ncbi:MAG: hypothetical protein JJ974_05635 [Phycisphaerales bacterium]|nr:hypothetical protein [Phycisphaerales bacterium]
MGSLAKPKSIGVPEGFVEYFVSGTWRLRCEQIYENRWTCSFVGLDNQDPKTVTLISANLESHFAFGATAESAAEEFVESWNKGFE